MARTMATTSDAAMRKKTPLHVSIFLIHDTSLAAMKFRLPSLFASFAAGALAVAGFAPLSWWPLAILSLAALFALAARADGWRAGFKLGFAYGLGLFLVGVSWIYVSLSVYGGMAPWLAALAVLLFAAYLALWPALAAAVTVSGWARRPMLPGTLCWGGTPATDLSSAGITLAIGLRRSNSPRTGRFRHG